MFYKETNFKDTKLAKVPENWNVTRLGDVSLEVYRYPTYYNIAYVPEGIPEIRGKLIKENAEIESDVNQFRFITQETSKKFQRTILKEGDFVISVRGTMGKIAMVPKSLEGANITANLIRISLDATKCYPPFLKQFFLSMGFQKTLNNLSSQTTIRTIQAPKLKSIAILLPPMKEQHGITQVLSCVDLAIQKTDEVISKTERLKRGLMQKLLTEGTGHKEFKNTEIGKIPKEWNVVSLGRVAELRSEIIEPSKKRVNFVGLEHISSGETRLSNFVNDVSVKSTKYRFLSGDILYGKLRPYLDKAVLVDFEGVSSTDLLVLKTTPHKAANNFLVHVLHAKRFLQFAMSATSGTNYPRTSWKLIKKYRFGLPKIDEQIKIAKILSTTDNKLELEKKLKGKLERLKMGLGDVLLTGKVRVKVD